MAGEPAGWTAGPLSISQLEIEKVIVERGLGGAEVWASAFYNAESMTYLRYNPDPDYVKRVAARLKGEMEIKHNAVKQLTRDAHRQSGGCGHRAWRFRPPPGKERHRPAQQQREAI